MKDRINGWLTTFRHAWPLIVVFAIFGAFLGWVLRGCTPVPPDMVFERENYFILDQIIFTGPSEEAIEDAFFALNQADAFDEPPDIDFSEIEGSIIEINLRPNNGSEEFEQNSSNKLQADNQFCSGLSSDDSLFVIALARINNPNVTVEELLQVWEQIQASDESRIPDVTAEPNLITGSPDYPTGSTSTWEFAAADDDDYPIQWAFENIVRGTPDLNSDGAGVRVVVFDSVPSALVRPAADTEPTSTTILGSSISIDWVETIDPWTLAVSYPRPFSSFVLPPGADPSKDLSHHGLFSAQMVYAVAPASEIELVEVLNEEVVGNLHTLILAFNDRVLADEFIGQPTVVNMSLGIRVPPPMAEFQLPELGMEALRAVLQIAHCRNIVVVAAAGNNSQMKYPPELAHLPADWSSVIAVAASNIENQRSCFSNQGEIAAPGGDGRLPGDPIPGTPPPLGCTPKLTECPPFGGNCPYAVVGPIMGPTSSSNGLIFWSGSSFASPMVAGLAARILSEGPPDLTPDDVRHIIECGATEATFPEGIAGHPDRHIGEGVINVERTLAECMP